MPHLKRTMLALAAFVALGFAATPARADIVITQGPTSAADENIQFNDPGQISSGLFVTGRTNQTDTRFRFSSNENIITPAGGQARIEASDGAFSTLRIEPFNTGIFFTELDFNVNANTNGMVTITATENNGMMTAMTFSVASGGENFFQVLAINNQLIRSVTISSTSQIFQDIRQIRVGGVTTSNNPIPEPTTMLLLGTGLAGIAGVVRRRRANQAK